MTLPRKFFLGAVLAAALSLAANYWQTGNLERRLATAIQECERESERIAARQAADPKGPWSDWQLVGLECAPGKLHDAITTPPGVQGEVVSAFRALLYYEPYWGVYVAFCALLVGSLPGVWYFFLRRLREVASAVRGQDP